MSELDSIPAKAGSDVGGPRVRPPELPEEAVLLRIFLGEDDRYRHLPLYEAIVLKAREKRLAGATVLRGPLALVNRATCIRRKFFAFPAIFRW
jgi:Uncharacterized ACR, COG1993